jgi:hypothetical protein
MDSGSRWMELTWCTHSRGLRWHADVQGAALLLEDQGAGQSCDDIVHPTRPFG